MNRLKNDYLISIPAGQDVRLKKGMTKAEVVSQLGEPYRMENCRNEDNEKLIFKISNRSLPASSYAVLFIRQELFYVAKLH